MTLTKGIASASYVLLLAALTSGALGAQPPEPAGSQPEAIKVHGQWTVEVTNADGSVASRHEFANALQGGGPGLLAEVLTRTGTIGRWSIYIPGSLCARTDNGAADWCYTSEPGFSNGSLKVFPNLTIAKVGFTAELRGSITVDFAGAINLVATGVETTVFSGRQLPAPIAVAAGQIVQFTVVFSFS
jgi:hypothetical protein